MEGMLVNEFDFILQQSFIFGCGLVIKINDDANTITFVNELIWKDFYCNPNIVLNAIFILVHQCVFPPRSLFRLGCWNGCGYC